MIVSIRTLTDSISEALNEEAVSDEERLATEYYIANFLYNESEIGG